MTKRKITHYSTEFKQSSAELAVNSKQPMAQTAVDLGVNKTTLYGWVKTYYPAYKKETTSGLSLAETEELKRLRKENARLKQQRDILKKAAAYFASDV